jgi:hypothetical protein
LSAATKAEHVVLALGVMLFLNALVPWWYRVRTLHHTFLHNGGLTGWGIVAALSGFAAAGVVVARHVRVPAAFADSGIHVAFGGIAAVSLAVHGSHATGLWIGFWVEGALAALLVTAGLMRVRERRRGWV